MNDNQTTILRLLERHPSGITQADIVLSTGLTPFAVTMAMRSLRAAGLASTPTAGGPRLAWATPENCAVIKAGIASTKAVVAAAKAVRDAKAISRHHQQVAADDESDAFARPSIKRTIHSGWERPAVSAPFSVFTQGAAA